MSESSARKIYSCLILLKCLRLLRRSLDTWEGCTQKQMRKHAEKENISASSFCSDSLCFVQGLQDSFIQQCVLRRSLLEGLELRSQKLILKSQITLVEVSGLDLVGSRGPHLLQSLQQLKLLLLLLQDK